MSDITIPSKPTSEEIDKHFSALQDSVDLINKLKSKPSLDEKDQDTLERNKEHILIMLSKDYIANDSRDKSVFVAASA